MSLLPFMTRFKRLFPGFLQGRVERPRRTCRRRLWLEALEERTTPATFTWSGFGSDSLWSNGANWVGGIGPDPINDQGSASLIFPAATQTNTTNNVLNGIQSLEFDGSGYTLSGTGSFSSMTVGGNITAKNTTGANTIQLNLTPSSGGTSIVTSAGGQLILAGRIEDFGGTETNTLSGNGEVIFSADNSGSYTGTTDLQSGTLTASHTNAFGKGTLVLDGGNLQQGAAVSTITLRGNFVNNAGATAFNGGTGSATFSGTTAQTIGGSASTTFGGLTINNAAGVSLATAGRVGATLTLARGLFTDSGLTMAGGSTINRADGSLSAAPTFGSSVNVIYSNTVRIASGAELPTSSTVLNNFTVNNAGIDAFLTTSPTVNGNFQLMAGAFSTAANTLTVKGNFTNNVSPTAFFAGSGTTAFTGTSTQTIGGSASTMFNNLTVNNGSSGSVALVAGANPVVLGDLLLTAGSLSTGTNTLTVNGNVINNAGPTAFNGGPGTVRLAGMTTQSIGGTAPATFNNVIVSNGMGGQVTLANNARVTGDLMLSAGSFSAGANTLTLDGSFTNNAGTAVTLALPGTGTDAADNALAGGSNDPHYTVTGPGVPNGAPAVVYSAGNVLPFWVPNDPHSAWIGWKDSSRTPPFGIYTYTLSFDLTGFDPRTASLSGYWAADDFGSITLNGQPTGVSVAFGNEFSNNSPNLNFFTILSGFQSGVNTLGFVVNQPDDFDGLRVRNLALTVQPNGTMTAGSAGFNAGSGTVNFTGTAAQTLGGTTATTFNHLTHSGAGTLQLRDHAATVAGTLTAAAGTVDLSGLALNVGGLTGTGTVTDTGAAATVTVNTADTFTFAGALTGANLSVAKAGSGTLVLAANNTYAGDTIVNGGGLLINGSQPLSKVTVNTGAMLSGIGTVGALQVMGGTVKPGIHSGNLTSTGGISFSIQSIFAADIDAYVPTGSQYDQLQVQNGGVNLGGSTLSINLNPSVTPPVGALFTIISNPSGQPVQGIFAGLPEDAVLMLHGLAFQISYVGGAGHDVVLMRGVRARLVLAASANTVSFGQSITLTATASAPPGSPSAPTGPVMFFDGSNTIGSGMLDGSGLATLSGLSLGVGAHNLGAAYGGDSLFPSSAFLPISVTVLMVSSTDLRPSNLVAIAAQFTHSEEYFRFFLTQAFNSYVNRAPRADEFDYFLNNIAGSAHFTDEHIEALFIGAPEYYGKKGGTDVKWVTSMYIDLLFRNPRQDELDYWSNRLAQIRSPHVGEAGFNERVQAAEEFDTSEEREGQRVQVNYQTYLGRKANKDEVAFWVDQFLHNHQTSEDLGAGFVGSAEYFGSGLKGHGDRAAWVRVAYQDVLHRSAAENEVSFWTGQMQ